MFILAVFIGIYSYAVFALALFGLLTKTNILLLSLFWFSILALYILKIDFKLKISNFKLSRFSWFLISLLVLQLLVNLIGALGPELGFDALWYHLTQPKIWLQQGTIPFIPGPVFRYSVTPQLTETLYAAALALSGPIAAKLIHYVFGVLCLIVTYKLARRFLSLDYSLLSCLLLSSNLVFSWLQTTAYIDLARTFFESLALLLFLDKKYRYSAFTLGLAVCTKLVAFASFPVFIILLLVRKENPKTLLLFTFYFLLIPLPWLLFAAAKTGNPFYPVGSLDLAMPLSWNPMDLWNLFASSPDPLSPIYLISAPLLIWYVFRQQGRGVRILGTYVLLALFLWFVFPHTGGSRFFLPYLPALSVLTVVVFSILKDSVVRKMLIFLTLTLTLTSIVYRAVANSRYLPVILGSQSGTDFLATHLNFAFGDYVDTGHYLPPGSSVYPVGINNLFYIDAKLILPPQKPENAHYLLIRGSYYPEPGWRMIAVDSLTGTSLYSRI